MSKKPHRDHEEATIGGFQRDPRFAAEYLNAVWKMVPNRQRPR